MSVVQSFTGDVADYIGRHPHFESARILERLVEPDRVLVFRVAWENDAGDVEVHRAWRVQQSNAVGPYKGGLRFDDGLTLDVLRALAFEQTFKNALTGLPLGGAKGGSDFSPKGRSDREVMRFCQAFMLELQRHIGVDIDIPAGDIGVGQREIGYMMGAYRRTTGTFAGVMTGKSISSGGSEIRLEATGYGTVYFSEAMLARVNEDLAGKRAVVSGAGAVALFAAEKLVDRGAVVVALSDRSGTLVVQDGLQLETLDEIKRLKFDERGSLGDYPRRPGVEFRAGEKPWTVDCELAYPCATQNELDRDAARALVDNGCRFVVEGANMPCTPEAEAILKEGGVVRAPGKAANAGGVAISGIEMVQNRMNYPWDASRVHDELHRIMRRIHDTCLTYGADDDGGVDYGRGAAVASYERLARAMSAYGVF